MFESGSIGLLDCIALPINYLNLLWDFPCNALTGLVDSLSHFVGYLDQESKQSQNISWNDKTSLTN